MPEYSVKIEVPDKLTFFFDQNYVRYRVAYGGRASGKSWAAERGLLVRAIQKKIRILCCREYQNSIGESVKHTLEENIELLGLGSYFTSTKDSITCQNGSQFIFRGLHNNVSERKCYKTKMGGTENGFFCHFCHLFLSVVLHRDVSKFHNSVIKRNKKHRIL